MWCALAIVFLCGLWAASWAVWHGVIFSKYRKLPPGYYGLPLLGVLPYLLWNKEHTKAADDIAKKRGPIIRFRIGWSDVVLISQTEPVKEALKNDDLLGRPSFGVFDLLNSFLDAKPFIGMDGEHWRKVRNFSVRSLRDLGFGKTPLMEAKIQEEVEALASDLAKLPPSRPFEPRELLLSSVSNNIATLIFGDRLEYNHPKRRALNKFLSSFLDVTSSFTVLGVVPFIIEFLEKLGLPQLRTFANTSRDAKGIFRSEEDKHKESLEEGNMRDFMDCLLVKQKEDPETFTAQIVMGSITVLFGAGSNTTRIAVQSLLELAAAHPRIQEQMHKEIVDAVGVSRLPCWADRSELHLVNAFIEERMRILTVAPFGVPRRAMRDTRVMGYDIPKGTTVVINLDSVHRDPLTFEKPDEFRPERFLGSNGEFVASPNIIPFATGKRACPGETLAVFEIFLYISTILQRFKVTFPPGTDYKITRPSSLITEPPGQALIFTPRL